jgi:hypothetical protein
MAAVNYCFSRLNDSQPPKQQQAGDNDISFPILLITLDPECWSVRLPLLTSSEILRNLMATPEFLKTGGGDAVEFPITFLVVFALSASYVKVS